MRKGRMPTWLMLMLAAVGLVLLAIPGLWVYMSLTATPLHPDAGKVPTVAWPVRSPEAAGAVKAARQVVLAHLMEENLPGLSVAVGREGELVWAEGFGFADLRANVPITPEHRFRIGTASTALTSAAAGLLLEEGRLRLDDEIQKYVPSFPRKAWPVKLREAMGHTAGVVPDGGDEGPLFARHCEQPVEALSAFAGEELLFRPGTQYRDSSYGWILVSAAIEAAANQPFLALMRERVFSPLGMRSTGPDGATVDGDDDHPLFNLVRELIFDARAARDAGSQSETKANQDRVTSYFPRFAADPKYGLHLMRPLDYSCYAGSSGFLSTPSDLVRFAMAVARGRLLKPATVELLQTSQRLTSGEATGYGLGWDLETVTLAGKPTRVIGHHGDVLGGMAASFLTFPEHGITVAVTANISYANTASLAVKVAEAFVDAGGGPAR